MQSLPLHALLVHLPIGLALVLPIPGLLALRLPALRPVLVLLHLVLSAAIYAAMYTGTAHVEEISPPAPIQEVIDEHERRAQFFLLAALAALPLSAVAVKRSRPRVVLIAAQCALALLGMYAALAGTTISYFPVPEPPSVSP
ncbi:MAG: hypothetical protein H7A21_05880 [Spirochaetales bacterium]|nr:hypothetical protein [Leptospiraceae bacterium]MCP5480939.1 hypothetical protein [Spirochaetales bacterium]MCP5485319.1 hypothetical protein [Spirochaetales bacterium]